MFSFLQCVPRASGNFSILIVFVCIQFYQIRSLVLDVNVSICASKFKIIPQLKLQDLPEENSNI